MIKWPSSSPPGGRVSGWSLWDGERAWEPDTLGGSEADGPIVGVVGLPIIQARLLSGWRSRHVRVGDVLTWPGGDGGAGWADGGPSVS